MSRALVSHGDYLGNVKEAVLTAAAANHGSDQARIMAVEQLMRDVVDLYNQHTTSLKRRQSPAISGAAARLAQLHASYPDPEQWSSPPTRYPGLTRLSQRRLQADQKVWSRPAER